MPAPPTNAQLEAIAKATSGLKEKLYALIGVNTKDLK